MDLSDEEALEKIDHFLKYAPLNILWHNSYVGKMNIYESILQKAR
jgi:hypothetical protein